MIRQIIVVENRLGLHARAAAKLVHLASRFRSDVHLAREGHEEAIDSKSILGILMLAAGRGLRLVVSISGPDEVEAGEAIRQLFAGKFGEDDLSRTKAEVVFQGNGVSQGIALGSALKLDSYNRVILKMLIDDASVQAEIQRVRQAIQTSREQLEGLKLRLEEKLGSEHSYILDVHILMLEDKSLIADIESIIRDHHANAEWAVRLATDRIRNAYQSLDDEYFRERVSDIENVVERILLNLTGDKASQLEPLAAGPDHRRSRFQSVYLCHHGSAEGAGPGPRIRRPHLSHGHHCPQPAVAGRNGDQGLPLRRHHRRFRAGQCR